jgi:Group II intron, maturase-specific domain
MVAKVNRAVRDWGTYFRVGNSTRKFHDVDHYVHERLAKFLAKKAGRGGHWKRSTVSGPQRLQPCAWTAPDLSATAPALDSTRHSARLPKKLVQCRPPLRNGLRTQWLIWLGPAAEEVHGFELQDHFALLVYHLAARTHYTPIGAAARPARLEHHESSCERVAWTHWLEPAQIVDAWRAQALARADHGVDQQPHVDRRRVPAAGDEATVDRAARSLRVGVHWLRVIRAGELNDAFGGERKAAQFERCGVYK